MDREKEDRIISEFLQSIGPWRDFIIIGGGYALIIYRLYSNNFTSLFWATRKLSEFVDLKWPHISNIRSFKIGKLRCFGAAENPTFEVV